MPRKELNPKCNTEYKFDKDKCKCILKQTKKKKLVVVKKLKKTVKIKSKSKSKSKTPEIPLQSKVKLLEKYGAVVVKKRGSVITKMVGEKLINRAFELVQKLETVDIKKVKMVANKAIDQELRVRGISPQYDTSKWAQDLRNEISTARRTKLIKIVIQYSTQSEFNEELDWSTPKTEISLQKKRKRCPNGTKKNPKTGECEPKNKTLKAKPGKKATEVIPSSTPQDLKVKGDLVMETIGKVKKRRKGQNTKKR